MVRRASEGLLERHRGRSLQTYAWSTVSPVSSCKRPSFGWSKVGRVTSVLDVKKGESSQHIFLTHMHFFYANVSVQHESVFDVGGGLPAENQHKTNEIKAPQGHPEPRHEHYTTHTQHFPTTTGSWGVDFGKSSNGGFKIQLFAEIKLRYVQKHLNFERKTKTEFDMTFSHFCVFKSEFSLKKSFPGFPRAIGNVVSY